jgi:hypothetical protein
MLFGLTMLSGCQAKREMKAPCPPISGYAETEHLCGPTIPVNAVFTPVLKE